MDTFFWNKFRLLHNYNLTRHWLSHFGLSRKATFPLKRAALVWVITQREVIISYGPFGTTYRAHPQGSRIQTKALSMHYHTSFHPKHLQQSYWLTPHCWDFSPPTLFHIYTPFWGKMLYFGFLNPENGINRSSRNVRKKLSPFAA